MNTLFAETLPALAFSHGLQRTPLARPVLYQRISYSSPAISLTTTTTTKGKDHNLVLSFDLPPPRHIQPSACRESAVLSLPTCVSCCLAPLLLRMPSLLSCVEFIGRLSCGKRGKALRRYLSEGGNGNELRNLRLVRTWPWRLGACTSMSVYRARAFVLHAPRMISFLFHF